MKKLTFKEYFSTLFRGIGKAVMWVVGLFGYKDDSSFGKVVKRIFASSATILLLLFTGYVLYTFATDVIYNKWIRPFTDDRVWSEEYISNHIAFQQMYYSDKTRIYDKNKEIVLLENVDWVVISGDNDSLAVFARNGRRGYINRFNGEIRIPELFTRAWVFSEGLAAVEKDGKLMFIDHSGNIVIDKDFQAAPENPKYAFKKGYCIIENPNDGKIGLIDHSGNWVLKPEYDNLFNNNGFWIVEKDGCAGLYTSELNMMFPIENTGINIYNDIIEVRHADHTAKRYDLNGNVVVDFVIDDICNMQYETTELRNDLTDADDVNVDKKIYGIANCQRYLVKDGHTNYFFGLLDRNGKIVTQPIYTDIQAIGKNRYFCKPDGVILDDKGKIIR